MSSLLKDVGAIAGLASFLGLALLALLYLRQARDILDACARRTPASSSRAVTRTVSRSRPAERTATAVAAPMSPRKAAAAAARGCAKTRRRHFSDAGLSSARRTGGRTGGGVTEQRRGTSPENGGRESPRLFGSTDGGHLTAIIRRRDQCCSLASPPSAFTRMLSATARNPATPHGHEQGPHARRGRGPGLAVLNGNLSDAGTRPPPSRCSP
jgi:hypothetical protein